jgi:pimeloyl-ACP methyl ester carboxylesterase
VGHHWQAWRPVISLLAAQFDVVACDTPGFGASAPLASSIEPTIPAYVDAFEWFFAELGLERHTWRATRWVAQSHSSWRATAL